MSDNCSYHCITNELSTDIRQCVQYNRVSDLTSYIIITQGAHCMVMIHIHNCPSEGNVYILRATLSTKPMLRVLIILLIIVQDCDISSMVLLF